MNVGQSSSGPLNGVRIVEMSGIGPVPFCSMLLADMGADVLTIDPPAGKALSMPTPVESDPLWRGRTRIQLDLKSNGDQARMLDILSYADVLLEGFRPGAMERLGLGPTECLARNQALVYGRMTGWGQDGPMAMRAGHDPNFLAISGVLHALGPADRPPSLPLNLVGDFGGGALYLAVGVLAALLHARETGKGQVVDASMSDGAASLMSAIYGMKASGLWRDDRGVNFLDGGCPYVSTYETDDARYVVVAAVEPPFYANFLSGLGLDGDALPPRDAESNWPELRKTFEARFKSKSRDEWARIFESLDACVSPVLDMNEAPLHPQHVARKTFVERNGHPIPAPAPRFMLTPTSLATGRWKSADTLIAAWTSGRG